MYCARQNGYMRNRRVCRTDGGIAKQNSVFINLCMEVHDKGPCDMYTPILLHKHGPYNRPTEVHVKHTVISICVSVPCKVMMECSVIVDKMM